VENLTLTNTSTTNVTGTGNSGDNILMGSSGANTLVGGAGNDTLNPGSAGTDTLQGQTGDDTYIVDRTGITLTEAANEGTDTVKSSITFTLATNFENLTLTNTGTTVVTGTGNSANNVLTGSSGSNTLVGGAGDDTLDARLGGTDILQGQTGNDTYIIDRTTTLTLTEAASEGTDTVQSSVTFTLGTNFENLTLTGSAAINATGNSAGNVLTGNAAANTLSGGLGADTYQYTSGGGADTIDNVAADSLIDQLTFTDLASSAITFSKSGNNLIMTRTATPTDTVTVTNWFAATANRLDFVNFTNKQVTAAQIDALFAGGGSGGVLLVAQGPGTETFATKTYGDPSAYRAMLLGEQIEDPAPQTIESAVLAQTSDAPAVATSKLGASSSVVWQPIKTFLNPQPVVDTYALPDGVIAVPFDVPVPDRTPLALDETSPKTLASKSGASGANPVWEPIKTFLNPQPVVDTYGPLDGNDGLSLLGSMTLGEKSAKENPLNERRMPIKTFLHDEVDTGVSRLVDAMSSFGMKGIIEVCVDAEKSANNVAIDQLAVVAERTLSNEMYRGISNSLSE